MNRAEKEAKLTPKQLREKRRWYRMTGSPPVDPVAERDTMQAFGSDPVTELKEQHDDVLAMLRERPRLP